MTPDKRSDRVNEGGWLVAFVLCMDGIELLSHAKVNLTLEVGVKRADGYHEIDSVVQVVGLSDRLSMERADAGVIEVECNTPGVPSGPENSVYTACEAFLSATGISGGVRCRLTKRIPAQAGLGGGSGNAAAAVLGLDRLYETSLPVAELAEIAACAGSDAALFVYGGTVRMRGRGDLVKPLPDAQVLDLVIVKPECGISTAWAYAELDKVAHRELHGASDRAEAAIRTNDREGMVRSLVNDFDPVVCAAVCEIERAKRALLQSGALAAMLCGSGSAVFGVFESKSSAERASSVLQGEFAYAACTRSLSRAEAGASVL